MDGGVVVEEGLLDEILQLKKDTRLHRQGALAGAG